jgi:hypothetical protein
MKYAFEMGSDIMIYVHITFHKDWFRHSEGGSGDAQTHRQHEDRISLLPFFKIRKVG